MRTTHTRNSKRYLAIYSYVGTPYNGIQRDPNLQLLDKKTILDVIEKGLNRFNKKQMSIVPKVRGASRTDVGVHALQNAFTFDAADNQNRKEYSPESLRMGLNNYFNINKEQIQINEMYETKDPWFDCRGSPQERSYIYKILLTKEGGKQRSALSLFNKQWAWELDWNTLDLAKFEEAAKLFEGHHYFKHFVRVNNQEPDPKGYMRTINSMNVTTRIPELIMDTVNPKSLYLLTEINAKSFLWHQIRIMMWNIVQCAQGKISKDQIIELLQCSDEEYEKKYKYREKVMAPPQGLYLTKVKYDQDNFIL